MKKGGYLYSIILGALLSLGQLGFWMVLDQVFGFTETKRHASMLFTFGWSTAALALWDYDK